MQKLPDAEIYLLEMKFMPWGLLMKKVITMVINKVSHNGMVLDLMCGPGYLLEMIQAKRPDLLLVGVDSDSRYIDFGSKKNKNIQYIKADVLSWKNDFRYDCVLCTAGVHHLPNSVQPQLFVKMASLVKNEGFCICADPCINKYNNETERQLAAAELGYEYLKAVLKNQAPSPIINATLNILRNDVLADGEYKNSLSHLIKMAKKTFQLVGVEKVWPETISEYGDYFLILKKIDFSNEF